jgi:dTDP-4-dehydrorhamnose reductase
MSIRIAVTGRQGQVARALWEAGEALDAEIVLLGRPQLDLAAPETIQPALKAAAPDIVVRPLTLL